VTTSPLDAARGLAPQIRSCADDIELHRELPRPLFEALFDAGLYQMALPRSLGCLEIDLPSYIEVIEELGKADASTAWTVNQGGIFATLSSRMPHEKARAIWIDTPRAVVANTPLATFKAIAVEGGFRISGRGGFSTGSRHASWFAAHAQLFDGEQPRLQPNGQPETRFFFVPREEVEIQDTWRVRGLRGTGTHHFASDDVFVPEGRCVGSDPPWPLVVDHALYRIPRTLLFASGDAAIALGLARASLDTFIDLSGAKTPRRVVGLLREQPMVQADVGLAEANLRSGRALLASAARELWAAACEGPPPIEQRASMRLAATHTIRLAADVVDTVYNAAGATAIYESHVLQRYFQDAHVITQHIQGRRAHYELVGRYLLGLPIVDSGDSGL
jgi:alkylation response protein AidB-like acyl-CoA dehydrogenase